MKYYLLINVQMKKWQFTKWPSSMSIPRDKGHLKSKTAQNVTISYNTISSKGNIFFDIIDQHDVITVKGALGAERCTFMTHVGLLTIDEIQHISCNNRANDVFVIISQNGIWYECINESRNYDFSNIIVFDELIFFSRLACLKSVMPIVHVSIQTPRPKKWLNVWLATLLGSSRSIRL